MVSLNSVREKMSVKMRTEEIPVDPSQTGGPAVILRIYILKPSVL